MRAEIIFTGTELLLGQVLNTHAQYLGRELTRMGIEITRHTTVGDNRELLAMVLKESLARVDILIITGGLGPTEDDLTRETVAGVCGLEMVTDEPTLEKLKSNFSRRGLTMPGNMKKQAMVPRDSIILPNPKGTAPGLVVRKGNKLIIVLPGPPRELKTVFEGSVKGLLEPLSGQGVVMYSTVLKLTGLSESQVQDMIQELHEKDNPAISYVAMPGEVHVRVTARSDNERSARKVAGQAVLLIEQKLGDFIYARDDEVLEKKVGKLLAEKGLTISVAESCTGGQIMSRLTNVPGCSGYFAGGVVSYSNDLKVNLLGVPEDIIAAYGAVSEQTARAMATGIRKLTGTSLGIGVTGIAGPDGGTAEKPVGLVYIAMAAGDTTYCDRYIFPGSREGVRNGATNTALNMVRKYITGTLGGQKTVDTNRKNL